MPDQIPSFDDFLKTQPAPPAAPPKVWTLDSSGRVKRFFRDTFKRDLPVTAFGQSGTHDRMGLDHAESMDVGLHPSSAEGRALIDFLKAEGIPFLAYDRAVPGGATGPHIHVGLPSKGLGAQPPAGVPSFDEFLGSQPATDNLQPTAASLEPPAAGPRREGAFTGALPSSDNAPGDWNPPDAGAPAPSRVEAVAAPTFDPRTQEGRRARDERDAAKSAPGVRQVIELKVEDPARLNVRDLMRAAILRAAAQRGVPEDFASGWVARNPRALEMVDASTGRPVGPEALAVDPKTGTVRLAVRSGAYVEDEYKKSRGTLARAVDFLTDDRTSPGEKFVGVAEPAVSGALRAADLGTRPLQAASAGFWARARGADDVATVYTAFQEFFGEDPALGRNVIAEALRDSERLKSINPRLPALLGTLAEMVADPTNLAPAGAATGVLKKTAAGARLLDKAGDAGRAAGLLERGVVEARPLGIGELSDLRAPTLRPQGDDLLRGMKLAPGEEVDTFSGRVFKDGSPTPVRVENGRRVYDPDLTVDARRSTAEPFGRVPTDDPKALRLLEVETLADGRKVRVEVDPSSGRVFRAGRPTLVRMVDGEKVYDPGTGTVGREVDPPRTRFTATETGLVFDETRKALPPGPEAETPKAVVADGPTAPDRRESLTSFVVKGGGVRDAGGNYRGEMSYLVGRQGGRPGLVNNKTGRAPDRWRENANEAGYGPFETDNDFLSALAEDSMGQKSYFPASAYDDVDYEALFRQHYEKEATAVDRLLDDEHAARWLEYIAEGKASGEVTRAFRVRAKDYGLSDGDVTEIIADARRGRYEAADAPEGLQGAPEGEGLSGVEGRSLEPWQMRPGEFGREYLYHGSDRGLVGDALSAKDERGSYTRSPSLTASEEAARSYSKTARGQAGQVAVVRRADVSPDALADEAAQAGVIHLTTGDRVPVRFVADANSPKTIHEQIVERALAEGKPVPPEVLDDYPDLARQYGGPSVTDEEIDAIIAESQGLLDDADVSFDPSEFNASFDPRAVVRGAVDVGRTLYRAGMSAAEFGAELVRRLGEKVRPYLDSIYERAKAFHADERGSIPNPFHRPKAAQPPLGAAQGQILSHVRLDAERPSLAARVREHLRGQQAGVFETTGRDKLAALFADDLAPVMKAVGQAKEVKGVTLRPEADPEYAIRLLQGENGKFDRILDDGPLDAKNRRAAGVGGGVEWLYGAFDNTSKEALARDKADAVTLLLAERVVDAGGKIDAEAAAKIAAMNPATNPKRIGVVQGAADAAKRNIAGFGQATGEADDAVALRAIKELRSDPARLAKAKEAAARYRAWADANLRYWVETGRMSPDTYRAIKAGNQHYAAMQRVLSESDLSVVSDADLRRGAGGGGRSLGSAAQPVKRRAGSQRALDDPYSNLLRLTHDMYREADRNRALAQLRDLIVPGAQATPEQKTFLESVGRRLRPHKDDTTGAVKIYVGGREELWKFEPGIEAALKGWGQLENPGLLGRVAQFIPRLTRDLITHSPDFLIRNPIRDAGQRAIVSEVGSKPWDILKGYSADELARYKTYGGDNAGHYFSDRVSYHKELARRVGELTKDGFSVVGTAKGLLNRYDRFARSSEYLGRLAEFRRAYQHARTKLGYDDHNANLFAAKQARELLDFAQAGKVVREVNKIIPFTNASAQGLRRSLRAGWNQPAQTLGRTLAYVAVPSLLVYSWNDAVGAGEEYRQLPAYQRDFFWNFKAGPNLWIRIPKPFEFGVLGTGVERAIDRIGNERAFEGYGGSAARGLVPVDDAALLGPLRPLGEVVTNKDMFRDKEIVPESEDDKALELRVGTMHASRVGQAMQKIFRVDARKIDHLITSAGGGFGRLALTATDIGRDDKQTATAQYLNSATGLFTTSPASSALPVARAKERIKELGLEEHRLAKGLSRMESNYYNAKTEAEKDKAAENLRRFAAQALKAFEKMRPMQVKKAEFQRKKAEAKSRPKPAPTPKKVPSFEEFLKSKPAGR